MQSLAMRHTITDVNTEMQAVKKLLPLGIEKFPKIVSHGRRCSLVRSCQRLGGQWSHAIVKSSYVGYVKVSVTKHVAVKFCRVNTASSLEAFAVNVATELDTIVTPPHSQLPLFIQI